jgi:hypothetical protein
MLANPLATLLAERLSTVVRFPLFDPLVLSVIGVADLVIAVADLVFALVDCWFKPNDWKKVVLTVCLRANCCFCVL